MIFEPPERITIRFSKVKWIAIAVLTCAVAAGCAFMATHPDGSSRHSPLYVQTVSIAVMLICGAVAVVAVVRLLDRKPGLVIDRQGFDDRSHFDSVGRVDWADVRELRVMTVGRKRMLAVDVHDRGRFARRGNLLRRFMRMAPIGGPVVLGSGGLDVDFDTLVQIVRRFHDDWKLQAKPPLSPGPLGV